MVLGFATGVHHVLVQDRLILLDLNRDRYLALPSKTLDHLAAFQTGDGAGAVWSAEIERLLQAGILARTPDSATAPLADTLVAERDLETVAKRSDGAGYTCSVVAHLLLARAQLRLIPLHRIVTSLQSQPLGPGRGVLRRRPPSPLNVTAALRTAGAFLTTNDRCLSRAIAARRLLQRAGRPSEMIFGVVARPFQAHCWVQSGGFVVTDSYDHVRNFTPILSI